MRIDNYTWIILDLSHNDCVQTYFDEIFEEHYRPVINMLQIERC